METATFFLCVWMDKVGRKDYWILIEAITEGRQASIIIAAAHEHYYSSMAAAALSRSWQWFCSRHGSNKLQGIDASNFQQSPPRSRVLPISLSWQTPVHYRGILYVHTYVHILVRLGASAGNLHNPDQCIRYRYTTCLARCHVTYLLQPCLDIQHILVLVLCFCISQWIHKKSIQYSFSMTCKLYLPHNFINNALCTNSRICSKLDLALSSFPAISPFPLCIHNKTADFLRLQIWGA